MTTCSPSPLVAPMSVGPQEMPIVIGCANKSVSSRRGRVLRPRPALGRVRSLRLQAVGLAIRIT